MSYHATKTDWKALDPPTLREPLDYVFVFNDADADRLRDGLIPKAMEGNGLSISSAAGYTYIEAGRVR
jgi:hypothetical protein